jgi:5-methylcytosine-specific restriction protein A
MGRLEPAVLVDHVVPHKGDPVLMWDEGNWQASCRWHHDQVKQILERLFDQNRLAAADLRLDSPRAVEVALGRPPA